MFCNVFKKTNTAGVPAAQLVGTLDIVDNGVIKVGGSTLATAELGFIDGAIAGTGVASKALVLSSTLTTSISGSGAGAFLTVAPGTTGAGLKIHTHANVNNSGGTYDYTYMNEFKGEFVSTSGTMVGVGADYTLSGSGTGAMCASSGYAKLLTGITMSGTATPTAGILTGGQFFANVAGTLSGAGVEVMGLYGGIDYNTGGTITTCDFITGIHGEYRSNVDCGTGTSSILRLTKGGTASTAVDYAIYVVRPDGTITTGFYLPSATTGINLSGTYTTGIAIEAATSSITFGTGDGKIVDAADSLSIYGGNTTGDSLVLYGSSADTSQKITILGNSGTTILGAIKLDGTVTLDDDGTIADASNVTTITQNTITLVGATKINLDGATDVTGILTVDTAGSPADGIKISATTPTDGLEISSACGSHAINISAAQTGAGITIGSTCGTYGLNIVGACTTAAINLGGASAIGLNLPNTITTTGIRMLGGTNSYVPIHIGTKASDTGANCGIPIAGDTDDAGGVQIYMDDGNTTLTADVGAGLRSRVYLKANHSAGKTICGTFSQLVTAASKTMTGGVYNAAYVFNQVGTTLALASGAEYKTINAATTVAGTNTIDSGCIFAGVDVNIRGTATFTGAGTVAALLVRSLESVTWSVGLRIVDSGATTGILIGTCTTGISLSGTYTTGISAAVATSASGRVEYLNGTIAAPILADGYGFIEHQVTVTGTAAGSFAAASTWVNFDANSSAGANTIYLHNDGFYASATGTPCSTATLIGHRYQFDCSNLQPAAAYLFSVNPYNISLNAVFYGNDKADFGWVTGTLSGGTASHFPLFKVGSVTHYVNTFTA